jgi:predicted methyltransferase
MTEKYLRKIYNRFIKFRKRYFILDAKKYSTSLQGLKLSDKTIGEFYDNYYKIPYISFLENIKYLLYSKNAFDFVLKDSSEDWALWPYLQFLAKKKLIKVNRNGKISPATKEILKLIPKPQTEKEIRKAVEKKLKTKIKNSEPVINLFKKFRDFEVKAKWDQMPISQGSAIFVVEKILERLPLKEKFLFVGDDDFVSVILGLAAPEVESLVIDADDQLLDCINLLAKKFKLKIKTKKVDIRKKINLGEKFIGFLTNPVYTTDGVKEFVNYGKNQLGKDGGVVFLEVGDESIGNRFLTLQEFFAKNGLIVSELIRGKIFYPYIELYQEDKEILRRLSKLIDGKIIKKSPKLAASLYIFKYLPSKIKKVKFKKPFYAYL